ncbi:hypothetical protein C8E00_101537 [Chromohalobacter marismortui]|uniref:Uncharacterized protein n=1 Tax=Chromohalobacter marismortui TaxID=42055 RepID=A0A4R7NVE2_9GAMM|nr:MULTISPECIES: hypothetical protein [Chromohalobacter]MCI0510281.1 hypothetical protein [Chromohalobacter sp.]TDU25145.1 hypothetical protein C8E00_101537 [Chromohalobacter marismortui]
MSFLCFTKFFLKGLKRNFKIIRYGDAPEIYNTTAVVERYAFAAPNLTGFSLSIKELGKHLLSKNLKVYDMPESPFIYCGGSVNNEREFYFFSQLMLDELSINNYRREENLSFVPTKKVKKTKFDYILSLYLFVLCFFYLFRIKLGPVSLKYLITYSKVFLNLYTSTRRQNISASVLVVANDHTDFPVVASMVMQYWRKPVVYVQHAEVSGSFPPLDFDVSILRNKKTLDVYSDIGKVSGSTYIVPRCQELQSLSELFSVHVEARQIVIYLSSVFSQCAVQACIDELKKNGGVASVGVKPHPRADRDFLTTLENVNIYDSIPSFKHVALVPNSSVVIELLESGVPVFQYFGLDDIKRDYYGFVNEEIAPEVSLNNLSEPFWKLEFYDEDWLSRFSEYSPSVNESWRKDLAGLISKMKSYM